MIILQDKTKRHTNGEIVVLSKPLIKRLKVKFTSALIIYYLSIKILQQQFNALSLHKNKIMNIKFNAKRNADNSQIHTQK
jgi:uncharacterized membrane protein YqhA